MKFNIRAAWCNTVGEEKSKEKKSRVHTTEDTLAL